MVKKKRTSIGRTIVRTVEVGDFSDGTLNISDYVDLPVDTLTASIIRSSSVVHVKITNIDLNVVTVDTDMLVSSFGIPIDSKFDHKIEITGTSHITFVYSELVIR